MRNQKGFTLIELIMVIVILGILAAVVVPKFFDFTTDAHKSNVRATIGTFKSGLEIFSADQIVSSGYKKYPKGDVTSNVSGVLEQVPEKWSFVDGSGNKVTLRYTGDTNVGTADFEYECDGGASYTLKAKQDGFGYTDGQDI